MDSDANERPVHALAIETKTEERQTHMMVAKKILVVSMGRAGNAVASAFLDKLMLESGVGPNGEPPSDPNLAAALEVFCDRTSSGHLVPRRLMAAGAREHLPPEEGPNRAAYPGESYILDETPSVESTNYVGWYTEQSSVQRIFDKIDNFVLETKPAYLDHTHRGSGSLIWQHYNKPKEVHEFESLNEMESKILQDMIRDKEPHEDGEFRSEDATDRILRRINLLNESLDQRAVLVFFAVAGGYGSGCGSLLLEQLKEEFVTSKLPVIAFPITPFSDPDKQEFPWEPYNAGLACRIIWPHANASVVLSNDAAYKAAQQGGGQPDYPKLNHVIAEALCTLVAPILWPDANGQRLGIRGILGPMSIRGRSSFWPWRDGPPHTVRVFPVSNCIFSLSLAVSANAPDVGGAGLAKRLLAGDLQHLSSEAGGVWHHMAAVYSGPAEGAAAFKAAIPNGQALIAINPRAKQARVIAGGMNSALKATFEGLSTKFDELLKRHAWTHYFQCLEYDADMNLHDAGSYLRDTTQEIANYADKKLLQEAEESIQKQINLGI